MLKAACTWIVPAVGFTLVACTCLPKGATDMDVGIKGRGIASWYGQYFQGWLTASGEFYDMNALTAAHRTLPLGTVVRVTNVANGQQTRVRINDRGPYVNGRVLDLSHAAARALDMVQDGVSPVQLEVIGLDQLLVRPVGLSLLVTGAPNTAPGSTVSTVSDLRRTARKMRHDRPLRLPPTDMLRERRTRRLILIRPA